MRPKLFFFLLMGLLTSQFALSQCGSQWGFKKDITINSSLVSGGSNLIDFPLLIDTTDLDLRTTANGGGVENANGYDISFMNENNELLAHELMTYNGTTGELIAWVKVPILYASLETTISIVYGNSEITTDPSTSATWNSNYEAVLHLQESGNGTDDEFKDATANGHDGTGGGLAGSGSASETPTRVAGKFGFAQDFDDAGSDDFIRLDAVNDATWTGVTVEAWVNPDDNGDDRIFGKSWGTGTDNQTWLLRKTGGTGGCRMRTNTNNNTGYDPATLGTGSWQHMAFTWNAATNELSVYHNGNLEGTTTLNGATVYTTPTVDEPTIGNTSTLNRGYDGLMQETRVSKVARSAGWLATQFNNQNSPQSFISMGTEQTGNFSPVVPSCGYSFHKVITIDSDSVSGSGSLTDYPLLVTFTDADLATIANGGNVQNDNGYDIIFTDSNLVVYDHQIEEYNASTGLYTAWVKLNSLPAASDLEVHMFYGNSNVFNDPSTSCVWSSDHQGVWHLENDFSDASESGNNGTNNGSTNNTGGIVGSCQSFDGTNDYIDVGVSGFADNDENQTISIWAQFSSVPSGNSNFMSVTNNASSSSIQLGYRSSNSLAWKFGGTTLASSGGSESTSDWHNYVYTYDGTTHRFYVDGQSPATSTVAAQTATPNDADIGRWTGSSEYFAGLIDEVRYSTNVKSEDYIKTQYTNIKNPSAFYSVSSENELDHSTTQSGDWDQTGTWVSGSVPGFGSNVTVLHDLDLDDRDEFICSMTITNSNNSNSSFEIQNAQILQVKEDVFLQANGDNDVTLQLDDDNSKIIVYDDLIVQQSAGDDVLIDFDNPGDSLLVSGDLLMEHDGGDNMEIQMDNASATFSVSGNCTVDMNSGSDDLFEIDLNAGELIISGNMIAQRSSDFGDLEWDLDGGNFTVDSLSVSSSGGGGSDQIIISIDETSVFTTNSGMLMSMGGGDDHQIYLNNNGGSQAQFVVNGDFLWNKTGGDDALFIVDDADSEFHITGDFRLNSSGAEEIDFNLDNGEFNVDGTFLINETKSNADLTHIDMDGCVMTVGDSLVGIMAGDANFDFHFDLDGTSIINAGTFIGTLDGQSGNEELLVDIDNSAAINVTNDLVMTANTGNDLEFHLGVNSGGSTASLDVDGDMTLDHNGAAGVDDIQFIVSDNSTVDIAGVFTMDTDGSGGGAGNFYTELNDDVVFSVGSNIVMDNTTGSGYLEIEMNDNAKIEIGGSFIRNASPNNYGLVSSSSATTTIEYDGTGTQIFADEDGAGTDGIEYELVIINNSHASEPQLTLEDDVTLTNNINFIDGVLSTSSTEILTIDDDATTNGGSLDSYVDGPIRKIGDDAFEFPVGEAGIWSRIAMSAPFNATTTFEAEYVRGNPNAMSYDTSSRQASIYNVSGKDYWILDKITAGDDSVFVTLHWENADTNKIDDLNDLKVVRWDSDSVKWIDHDQSATSGADGPIDSGTVTSDFRIQKFSPFTFGSGSAFSNPLPIELLSFIAVGNGDVVELKWTTISEINNDYFTVERSRDGINFEQVVDVDGAGNSRRKIDYLSYDDNPYQGYSYYRLKQTDFDGAHSYSKIVAVNLSQSKDFLVYPNPVSGQNKFFFVEGLDPGQYTLELYRVNGEKAWFSQIDAGEEIVRIELSDELSGLYIVKFISDEIIITSRLVIQK